MGGTMSDDRTTAPDPPPTDDAGTRRNLLLGLGALAGAGVAVAGMPGWAGASPAVYGPAIRPEALAPPVPGLTYLNIDAQAFWPTLGMTPGAPVAAGRIYQDATGS